jgi:hypothetical protein
MSVTVFMRKGRPVVIGYATQWNFTPATLELGDEHGNNVCSFLRKEVRGCALNERATGPEEETGGAYRDKTGDHFGLGAPEEDDDADDRH